MTTKALTGQQISEAGLTGWAFLQDYGLFRLETRIRTGSFSASLALVASVGAAAEELGHQADFDLRGDRVDVRLTSGYEAHGVTEVDVALARRITSLVLEAGFSLGARGCPAWSWRWTYRTSRGPRRSGRRRSDASSPAATAGRTWATRVRCCR